MMTQPKILRGRCTAFASESDGTQVFIDVPGEASDFFAPQSHRLTFKGKHPPCQIGDWVEIVDDQLRVLARNRTNGRLRLREQILDPRRRHAVKTRVRVERCIRDFFESRDFLETRTPLLVASPGMETHIRPFELVSRRTNRRSFLPTSPEFALKKLLSAGLPRIFQIAAAFRNEPYSSTHHPEFTLLEWYRAFADMNAIMRDTEELIESIARTLNGAPIVRFNEKWIDVKTPWPRLRIRDLFQKELRIDIGRSDSIELASVCRSKGLTANANEPWDDLYFKLWLNFIEPTLPADRAVFVYGYPQSQAALSVVETHADGTAWARRFEAYAGGIELCNAFEELTDPDEQRRRFIKDMELRRSIYGSEFPENPIDEEFLLALREGLPPSGGNAVGVDRLVMLFSGEQDIERTQWLPSISPDFDLSNQGEP